MELRKAGQWHEASEQMRHPLISKHSMWINDWYVSYDTKLASCHTRFADRSSLSCKSPPLLACTTALFAGLFTALPSGRTVGRADC